MFFHIFFYIAILLGPQNVRSPKCEHSDFRGLIINPFIDTILFRILSTSLSFNFITQEVWTYFCNKIFGLIHSSLLDKNNNC